LLGKIMKIRLLIILMLVSLTSYAWENPFSNRQEPVSVKYSKEDTEEPEYNITLGSRFGIYIELGVDPIDEFTRKPEIYVTYKTGDRDDPKTKTHRIKIIRKDEHYPNGKLEFPCQLVVCEWKGKLTPNSYELWVLPKNKGIDLDPSRVTGEFRLEKPIIQSVTEIEGDRPKRKYIKVTGLYFSPKPKIFVHYTKTNSTKKYKQKCRLESLSVNHFTGESEATYSYKTKNDSITMLVDANGLPLTTVNNIIGRSSSSSASSAFAQIDVGESSNPAFGDVDADGDLDLLVGNQTGDFVYFENTGTSTNPVFTQRDGTASPFNGLSTIVGGYYSYNYAAPFLADLDGDGDLDLIAGSTMTTGIVYFKNVGSATNPVFQQLNTFNYLFSYTADYPYSPNHSCNPLLADIDADGDLDLIFNDFSCKTFLYKNTGSATNPQFSNVTGTAADPFKIKLPYILNFAGYRSTALGDVDGDGDLDWFTSCSVARLFYYYRNTGAAGAANFTEVSRSNNPFNDFTLGAAGGYGTPVFADINGDGKPDLISGCFAGTLYYFEN
jgi:VCBS repeat protein